MSMHKDNLLNVLKSNGDLNDVKPLFTVNAIAKEIPIRTWNCNKEKLEKECLDLRDKCYQKANHILYTEIPKLMSNIENSAIIRQVLHLPRTTPELRQFHEYERERLRKKQKLWETDVPNIIIKDVYNVLLPYCNQEFKESTAICVDYPDELFIELRPMFDEFCEKINCVLGWDTYSKRFGIRPNLTTTIQREIEYKTIYKED